MNSNILYFDIDTPIIKSIHKQTKRRQMKGKLLCLVCPYIIIIILLVLLYSLLSKMKQLDNQYNKLNKNVLEHIFSPYRTDIIESIEELSLLKHWIGTTVSDNKIITMKMVYKATKDGDEASSFHQKTQEGTNYLILIKDSNNNRFGGYTSKNFNAERQFGIDIPTEKKDEKAFLFSLTFNETYDIMEGHEDCGVKGDYEVGPFFGKYGDIRIMDSFLHELSYSNFPSSFWDTEQPFDEKNQYKLTSGKQSFQVVELEAYRILFSN